MTKPQDNYTSAPGFRWHRITGAASIVVGTVLFAPAALSLDLSSYAILAGSTITNTGTTTISGNIGLSPGTSITGEGPGANQIVLTNGTIHIADGVAVQAKSDLTSAFNVLMGRPSTPKTGDLGNGQTLTAGVYSYSSAAQLTGTLTLSGGPDDIFIIQVGSDLTTAPNSTILLSGGVLASNVFFVVGGSATLDTSTTFVGQILAGASISLNDNAKIICGAALAQTGAVTLIHNTINICPFTVDAGDITDILGDDITQNGGSVADAIAAYIAANGSMPLSFELLTLFSPTELAAALEQLSGELGTDVAPAGQQGMDAFLDLLGGPHGDSHALLTSYDQPQAGGTVSVMGYMPASPESGSAFAGFDPSAQPAPAGEWTTWMSAYGSQRQVDGDAGIGSHDTTSSAYGLAFGFERDLGPDAMFGLAVSGGGTDFDLDNSLGSGKSAMLQAALYARGNFDEAYVAGALAFGYHRVSLDRTLTIAGTDHFTADFDATNIAGEIEAGYHFGWFTPYAALRGQAFSTPAYSEVTESGASTFALDYDANVSTSLRTEIGARGDWSTDLDDGGTVNLYASAAWAHTMRGGDDTTATFQLMPGAPFVVAGAKPAADSLIVAAGAELLTEGGVALGTSVQGEVSGNAVTYGATAMLAYHW